MPAPCLKHVRAAESASVYEEVVETSGWRLASRVNRGGLRVISPIRAAAIALIYGLIASACSQSPVAPSRTAVQPTVDTTITLESLASTEAAGSSPEHLAAQGWDCAPTPTGNRVACSPPGQTHPRLLPGPPPPADRPPTLRLLVFENGVFIGTNLLIRSDLYRDQPCNATDAPYAFISRIGYYQCLHPVGG